MLAPAACLGLRVQEPPLQVLPLAALCQVWPPSVHTHECLSAQKVRGWATRELPGLDLRVQGECIPVLPPEVAVAQISLHAFCASLTFALTLRAYLNCWVPLCTRWALRALSGASMNPSGIPVPPSNTPVPPQVPLCLLRCPCAPSGAPVLQE